MTVRELIKGSLRLINVLAAGETPSAEEQQDAITSLTGLLDSWSTEGFTVPSRVREEFDLVVGQASYTIGPGGNFDTARPVEIERATIEDQTSNPTTESSVEIINSDQWAAITTKGISGIPYKLYPEGTGTLETINLFPVPSAANKVVLYSRKILLTITNANTEIALPPGYERALRYNLAVELAPEYGKSVPSEVAVIATEAKANIMRLNGETNYLEIDRAWLGGRIFNMTTGE